MNFVVDDKHFHATIDKMEGGKIMQSLLTSNESKYINYYSTLFEELWDNGIDAEIRIRDIEGGIDPANIEIIQNSHEALKRSSAMLFMVYGTIICNPVAAWKLRKVNLSRDL